MVATEEARPASTASSDRQSDRPEQGAHARQTAPTGGTAAGRQRWPTWGGPAALYGAPALVLYGLLPFDLAARYERFMGQFGMVLLLLIIFTNVVGKVIGPAVDQTAALLIGHGFLS